MRTFDPFVLRITGAILCAAGLFIACSSASDDTSTGTTPDGDGGFLADGAPAGDGATGSDAAEPPKPCAVAADCPSGVCNLATKLCAAATCTDSVKNGLETDIDCGGSCATKCDVAKACALPGDCTSGVCTDKKCQAPTSTDGVKNGTETGIDCGGIGNTPCADGQGCLVRTDCVNSYCKAGVCTAPKPDDGVQDGDETDVDCGGASGSKACADGLKCVAPTDCTSMVCTGSICQVPSATDTVKNGDESDVDCGGATAPGCSSGKTCGAGTDCLSGGCNAGKICMRGKSCTSHYGGDTCGTGGAGGRGAAAWEDCCTTIDVPSSSPDADAVTGMVHLEKYPVTSGRMRVFLESIGYDVRTWVQTARAAGQIPNIPVKTNNVVDNVNSSLASSWDAYLPTSFDGNANADEVADCDQGYWDYYNKTCCETVKDTGGACPAGMVYYNDGNGDTRDCHWYDKAKTPTATCPDGKTGVYNGTYTSIKRHLGGAIFRANSQTETGCYVGSPGTHSFRFPDGDQDFDPPTQTQEVYDTKTQNCVDYLVGQAFCAWDGGRLETFKEWQTAYTQQPLPTSDATFQAQYTPWAATDARTPQAKGSGTYFGCRFPTATDADQSQCGAKWDATTKTIELADWMYSYEYPNLSGADYISFLTPPGRTTGRGPYGHSDLLGAGFELTSSVNYNASPFSATHHWSGNGSWEVHNYDEIYGGATMLLNKYGKLGLRCVKTTSN